MLRKAARIADAARGAGVKVVYTRIAFQPNHLDLVANSPLMRNILDGNFHVDGTSGAAIVDEVKPEPGDTVVTHQRLTGFPGTQLDVLLRGAGIDTVVFCGVASNLSVEGTARFASDLGYRTLVVADLRDPLPKPRTTRPSPRLAPSPKSSPPMTCLRPSRFWRPEWAGERAGEGCGGAGDLGARLLRNRGRPRRRTDCGLLRR